MIVIIDFGLSFGLSLEVLSLYEGIVIVCHSLNEGLSLKKDCHCISMVLCFRARKLKKRKLTQIKRMGKRRDLEYFKIISKSMQNK